MCRNSQATDQREANHTVMHYMADPASVRDRGYMRYECPHCGFPMTIRTSRPLSPLTREMHLQCSNELCNFAGVAMMEFLRAYNHTNLPNKRQLLPIQHPGAPPADQGELALDP